MPDQDIIIADSVNLYDSNLIREADIDVAPQQAQPNEVLLQIFHVLDDVGQGATGAHICDLSRFNINEICCCSCHATNAATWCSVPVHHFKKTNSLTYTGTKSTCQASKKRYAIGCRRDTCSVTRAYNGNAVIVLWSARPHRYLGEPLMLHHLEAALPMMAHLQKVHAMPSQTEPPRRQSMADSVRFI